MKSLRHAGTALLLCAAFGADAQVYRCGDAHVYTDKPCDGAESVDLRSNLLQAGPRTAPLEAVVQPSPPLVLQGVSRIVSTPVAPPTSIWQEKDSRDAAQTNRTTGTYPR